MKQQVSMIGSVPLSLNELQLAPAMIGAIVQNRGHRFRYLDINLELFYNCNQQQDSYVTATEFLQDITQYQTTIPLISHWQQSILNRLQDTDILLVNIFSVLSQGGAWRLIYHARQQYPKIKILAGGIGSHKKISGSSSEHNHLWIHDTFPVHTSEIFGQILLDNHWIDDWQSNVDTDVLENHLPLLPTTYKHQLVDFSEYKIDNYDWKYDRKSIPMLGSHGCVRQCSFCDVIIHFPKYHFVEADSLTKNIVDAYAQTGISKIQFMDSLVNGSMSNFLSLLKNLAHAKAQGWLPDNFSWSGTYICRPSNTMLKEIHRYLKDSGADTMVIGVESGSDRIRFEMEKKFTNADLLDELAAFDSVEVKANLLFFPAWPTETSDDFQETLELFYNLSYWAHRGTVNSISLGSNGFTLIDNTPIDKNKDNIGLVAGPTNFLWKCHSNPKLDYWESLRRRRIMSRWAHHLGIACDNEASFIRNLIYNLKTHRKTIQDWTGVWKPYILDVELNDKLWERTATNHIKLRLINSGTQSVSFRVEYCDQVYSYVLEPGIAEYEFNLTRSARTQAVLDLKFKFSDDYIADIDQYNSGDYYSQNGVYIDLVQIDARDITMYGFNQMIEQHFYGNTEFLPTDYELHKNVRAVMTDSDLRIVVPAGMSLHEYISRSQTPDVYQEIDFLNKKLTRLSDNHENL